MRGKNSARLLAQQGVNIFMQSVARQSLYAGRLPDCARAPLHPGIEALMQIAARKLGRISSANAGVDRSSEICFGFDEGFRRRFAHICSSSRISTSRVLSGNAMSENKSAISSSLRSFSHVLSVATTDRNIGDRRHTDRCSPGVRAELKSAQNSIAEHRLQTQHAQPTAASIAAAHEQL
jgi:hypothetical protein